MDILGKTVSEKTAAIITEIEQRLQKTVKYQFTDPSKTQSFGQCDFRQPDAYYIYSKESLFNLTKASVINIPFETNILHELMHLCQIEEGFPHTGTIHTSQTLSDIGLYDSFGSTIVSSILDLNVDYRLKNYGYDSKYFYDHRINRAFKVIRRKFICDEPLDFIRYALMLSFLDIVCGRETTAKLLQEYAQKKPELVACITTLSPEISTIGYNDAESSFRSLAFLFDTFNLWITHELTYQNTTYHSTSEVQATFPDIRILASADS